MAQDHNSEKLEVANTKWYSYSPSISTLTGVLTQKYYYGPPGYGENPQKDIIEKYYILNLKYGINVRGDSSSDINSDTELNISKIQIDRIDLMTSKILEQFVGKKIFIEGELMHAVTMHDHTKILIKFIKCGLVKNN